MAAALPLLVIMEKGAEAAEALTGMEIYYKRVTDHLHNQPDAARSHAFDKQRMYELIPSCCPCPAQPGRACCVQENRSYNRFILWELPCPLVEA